jgi:hypothetical protein
VVELYGTGEDWKHMITVKGIMIGICNKFITNEMLLLKIEEYRGV